MAFRVPSFCWHSSFSLLPPPLPSPYSLPLLTQAALLATVSLYFKPYSPPFFPLLSLFIVIFLRTRSRGADHPTSPASLIHTTLYQTIPWSNFFISLPLTYQMVYSECLLECKFHGKRVLCLYCLLTHPSGILAHRRPFIKLWWK